MGEIEIEHANAAVPPKGSGGSPSVQVTGRSPRREYSSGSVTLKRKGSADVSRSSHARSGSSSVSTSQSASNRVGLSATDEDGEGGSGGCPLPQEDLSLRIAVDDETGHSYFVHRATVCDACSFCDDVCEVQSCKECDEKRADLFARYEPHTLPPLLLPGGSAFELGPSAPSKRRAFKTTYTLCELRRRNLSGSCWIVCRGSVYDVTAFLGDHPGGKRSVLRNAGGRDCEEDFLFHSKQAQKQWRQYRIGILVACSKDAQCCAVHAGRTECAIS
ncbi:unnamed protein product [Choristocarpus tenellus]